IEFFVAGPDLHYRVQPFRHRPGMRGFAIVPDAVARRSQMMLAALDRVEQAGMPGRLRLERNLEAEPPIGVKGLARRARDADGHSAPKILVRICRAELLTTLGPFGRDLPAACDPA